jgi:hypothetical protein
MLDLDAIEARPPVQVATIAFVKQFESDNGTLRCETGQRVTPFRAMHAALEAIGHDALVAELRAAREVVEAAQTALKAITDYAPGYEFPTPKEEADEEACEDCAAWRAKKHPIQYQCERHVHQKYRYEDRNKAIRAGQHWEMKRIAVAALDALAAYRAVGGPE